MRVLVQIIRTLLLMLLLLVITAVVALQIPSVQTYVTEKVTNKLNDSIDGELSIGAVYLAFIDRVVLQDVLLLDSAQDTVAHCEEASLSISPISFLKLEPVINKISLERGVVSITKDSSGLSLSKIFPQREKKDTLGFSLDDFNSIDVYRVSIEDFKFKFVDLDAPLYKQQYYTTVNWKNMEFEDINLDIRNLRMYDNLLEMELQNLSLKERSGASIKELSFNIKSDTQYTGINDFHFKDSFTDIDIPEISMSYENRDAFKDFANRVNLRLAFNKAQFSTRSVKQFVESAGLRHINLGLFLEGELSGTLNNLSSKGLKIYTNERRTYAELNLRLTGLPDARNTMLTAEVNRCWTTMQDLANIIEQASPPHFKKAKVAKLAPHQLITFKGSLNGFFDDFVAFGRVNTTSIGDINVDLLCRNDAKDGYILEGYADTREFNLGEFLQVPIVDTLNCSASFYGYIDKDYKNGRPDSHLKINNVSLSKFGFNGYNYSGIAGLGMLNMNEFDGRIVSSDPNLRFLFQGKVSFRESKSNLYRFNFTLGHANLSALNFDKRPVSQIQLSAEADFTTPQKGMIRGRFALNNIKCKNEEGDYDVGNINLTSSITEGSSDIRLRSSVIDGRYVSNGPMTNVVRDIKAILIDNKLDNLVRDTIASFSGGEYKLNLTTKSLNPLVNFMLPTAHIEPGTTIDLNSQSDGILDFSLKSKLLALNNNIIDNLDIALKADSTDIDVLIAANTLDLGNIELVRDTIKISVMNNMVDLGISYNGDSSNPKYGHLHSYISFPNPTLSDYKMLIHFPDAEFRVKGDEWKMNQSSIYLKDSLIQINNFGLQNRDQSLLLDGVLSHTEDSQCSLKVNKVDLKVLNEFMKRDFGLRGILNGDVKAKSIFKIPDIAGSLEIKDFGMSDEELGDITINSRWDNDKSRINLAVNNELNGKKPLSLLGYYQTDNKSLYAIANIANLKLAIVEPFVSSIFSNPSGTITSMIRVSGPLNNLDISSSNSTINNFEATLDFTKVRYSVNGPFTLDNNGVLLKGATLSDGEGGTGEINGGLLYNRFKDMRLDLSINADNVLGIRTNATDNSMFYGTAYASGDVSITGPFDNMVLRLNVTSEDNTDMHIPLSSSIKSQTNALTFINTPKVVLNPYDSLIKVKRYRVERAKANNFSTYITLNATEAALVQLEINKDMGDVLKARGHGVIDLSVDNNGFSIKGDYGVDEGSYRFVLLGLVSRNFSIVPGGTINFNGDIFESSLNVTANYRTKASIAPLLADSTSVSSRRDVYCGINISGNLSNPQLGFDIEVPDLDPQVAGVVQSALNTEDKRLKQFLTLLLSGNFIPDEQSGIVNSSSVTMFNATEIMTNQLNSVFQQLNIPLDLGFKYQPGSGGGNDLFDVAVSTQLFNNRVSVNGNIGNKNRAATGGEGGVVGDVDVQIKLNKSGKLRLTLFSQSADEYSNYLDMTQRNGIGVIFQEEFDTFKELWRKIFWSKKRKAEYEQNNIRN